MIISELNRAPQTLPTIVCLFHIMPRWSHSNFVMIDCSTIYTHSKQHIFCFSLKPYLINKIKKYNKIERIIIMLCQTIIPIKRSLKFSVLHMSTKATELTPGHYQNAQTNLEKLIFQINPIWNRTRVVHI